MDSTGTVVVGGATVTGTLATVTGASVPATRSVGTVAGGRVAGGRVAGGGRTAVAGGSGGGARVTFGINVIGVGTSTRVIFGINVIGVGTVTTGILIGPADALTVPNNMISVPTRRLQAMNRAERGTKNDVLIMHPSCGNLTKNT